MLRADFASVPVLYQRSVTLSRGDPHPRSGRGARARRDRRFPAFGRKCTKDAISCLAAGPGSKVKTPHAVGYNARRSALRAPLVQRTRAFVPSDADRKRAMDRLTLLKSLSFGSQVAEEEIQDLQSYFVETDQWSRIFGGKIDIVRGEKGTGKSAI